MKLKKIQIGFTGTQKGMTEIQKKQLTKYLSDYNNLFIIHHGDCIGADSEAHDIAKRLNGYIIIHPPKDNNKRAYCFQNSFGDEIREERPYLERNKDIVDESDLIIACPNGKERLRSGTWSTIRYAINKDKSIVIIYPDGQIISENTNAVV